MNTLKVPRLEGFRSLGQFAKSSLDCVPWSAEFPYKPKVDFAVAHDGLRLFIRFDVEEKNVKAVTTKSNGPVWEDSCAEFFVRVPGSAFYYNFETNCIGAGLAAKRTSRSDCVHFGEDKMSQIVRRSSLPFSPVDAGPGKWSLELEIPFALFCESEAVPQVLEANFYKCGDKTAEPHFLSWSPIDTPSPDFHRPEFFGRLILE